MNKKEALELINNKLNLIKILTEDCEKLAEEAGVSFSFPEPAYGMGGNYYSRKAYIEEYDITDPEEIENIMKESLDDTFDTWGWRASSHSC
jgi:hypothetical protein